jgi:hypothetical protein
MAPFSGDTRAQAERVQIRCYRSMTGEERYRLGVEMSDNARDISLYRLRSRNPGLSSKAIMDLFLTRVMGWKLPGA